MKKIFFALIALMTFPFNLSGQTPTYKSLWKQVETAQEQDLPQTEQKVLTQIEQKALAEQAYGQLLKAELQRARSVCSVAPDSLKPAVERLKQRVVEVEGDVPLQAIYYCVLGYIYQQNSWLDEDRHKEIGLDYYRLAMAHPAELAQVKATDYEPFVVKERDSQYFDHNLLSLISRHTQTYGPLCDYYEHTDNRPATLLAKLWQMDSEWPEEMEPFDNSPYLQRLDALIDKYQDLPECGEAVIKRYKFMELKTDATPQQKWEYLNEALQRWGKWKGINTLRNSLNAMTTTQYNYNGEEALLIPQRELMLKMNNLRNINSLTLKLYRIKADGETNLSVNYEDGYKKVKPLLTALPELTRTKSFDERPPYELFEDSIALPPLPVGIYMVEMESQPTSQVSRQVIYVSDVRIMILNEPGNKSRIVMVNATTGQPVGGGTVKVTQGYGNDLKTTMLTSDAKGECTLQRDEREQNLRLRPYTATDNYCPPTNLWGKYNFDGDIVQKERTVIFIDRAIYRPGQTVQAAAVVYSLVNGIDHKVMSDKVVTFELEDANGETVGEQMVITDRFGTATTQFTLPAQGLTGRYRLSVNDQILNFRVEEYKRPTFEVDIPQVKEDYRDGDTLTVHATARSYAGVPVQGATVKYKVVRRHAYWWWGYSRYWDAGVVGSSSDEKVMAVGEMETDDQGQFAVDVPMVLPKTKYPMFYQFVLTADVTDQAGESHQGQLSLPLGNRETALSAELNEKVLIEKPSKMTLHLRNAAGADIDAQVRYRIENENGTAVTKWLTADTNTPTDLPKLKSGSYKLHAETIGAAYSTDPLEMAFTMFSLDDKRPAADTREWFFSSGTTFPSDGSPVTVQVGSSDKNVYVVYSLFAGHKELERGTAKLSNELINRKLKYKDEYGNGLCLSYAWMKDGKMHSSNFGISRPMPDKQLKLKWQTFRDRLTPGQQEEWTLSITDANGERLDKAAQFMATLYDKSLDQLADPRPWNLMPYTWNPLPSTGWGESFRSLRLFFYGQSRNLWETPYELNFSHFDTDVFPNYYRSIRVRGASKRLMGAGLPVPQRAVVANDAMIDMKEFTGMDVETVDEALQGRIAGLDIVHYKLQDLGGEGQQPAEMQLRENLQETAFFMPQLLADSAGIVKMKFTLPESLTTWHFLGVAHTEDMMYGQMEGEAVASKDVMIQPNMPRFLRQGDEGTISARIINMSDQSLSGTATLQLLDPETEQVLMEQKQQVSLKENSTSSVSFTVNPSSPQLSQHSLLIARASIGTPKQSDGEQHYLAVLPNTERVTVTVPFTQIAPGTKTIDLKRLIPVDDPQAKLTVEYTNNPAWLMIQALPTVGHPNDDCAVCQATSLYANSIGRHILQQNPTAKHVFEQWKQEDATLSSLQSSLQKDQELKDLLLNETPWVMDADREEEQKQRLADFFDANTIDQRLSSAIDKLKKLQNYDGSWSWWPGMKGSAYMTTAISEILVRLNVLTSQQDETKGMLNKAFDFMGDDIVELVDEMKKAEKRGVKPYFPSHRALQWLYICALDGRKLPAKVNEANAYLIKLLKKDIKNQTILEKALSAIILKDKNYIKSLKEWTVYKEDMGRYYDTQRASYSWRDYKIPTQVAAIEALKRLTPQDTVTIAEMQRWLLQQKRTQAWDTPLNSVDAIYAFLDGNSQALAPQPKTVLAIDGKPLSTSAATAGIGYVKTAQSYNGQKAFTAEKTSTGTSWGAVYAQFTQPSKDIADQASGLSVKREVMMNGQVVNLNAPSFTLKVGDRITVRLTIEADRDYDFVQLVDKRAACMEPVKQLSGYDWRGGYYCAPKDNSTSYFFDLLSKGRHIITTEYYIDRAGTYETGSCTVQCAYSPEFRGTTKGVTVRSAAPLR